MPDELKGLQIDPETETKRLTGFLRHSVHKVLRRQGAVVGISGGVDSSVVLALCVRAFGADRVAAVILPEHDSEPQSEELARLAAESLGVEPLHEEITSALEGFGCYQRRDAAIQRLFPEFDARAGYRCKIVLPPLQPGDDALNVYSLTIIAPGGKIKTCRLPLPEFLQIVAASNFKQRTRMAMLYYHAECRHFAVIGTANKNEHDQGFFVKYGDGGVDVQPIVHLYKSQVYQLAEYLNIPPAIQARPPTTDTYSAYSTQEEFFFRMPFSLLDRIWYAAECGLSPAQIAAQLAIDEQQVRSALNDIRRKTATTVYLRTPPLTLAHAV